MFYYRAFKFEYESYQTDILITWDKDEAIKMAREDKENNPDDTLTWIVESYELDREFNTAETNPADIHNEFVRLMDCYPLPDESIEI